MVVVWLVGDFRSVVVRIFLFGSNVVRQFYIGYKYIFVEYFFCCSSRECLGRDVDEWEDG